LTARHCPDWFDTALVSSILAMPEAGTAVKKRKKTGKKAGAAIIEDDKATTAELEAIVFGRFPTVTDENASAAPQAGAVASNEATTLPLKKKKKRGKKAAAWETPRSAWKDPDDATLQVDLGARNRSKRLKKTDEETKVGGDEYELRLRQQFVDLHGSATWAEDKPLAAARDDLTDDEDIPLPTSAKAFGVPADGRLMPREIDIKRLRDITVAGDGRGPCTIGALDFHPNSELLLTAGRDKKVRLFSVDGEENPKVSSFFLKDFPVHEASFSPSGDQILVTGKDFRMWGLDVETGEPSPIQHMAAIHHTRYHGLAVGPCPLDNAGLRSSGMYSVLGDAGCVLVCDVKSRQPIRSLRMSNNGVAVAFSPEKDLLYSADSDCNVYVWDLATGRCQQKMRDPWATGIVSLAVSRSSRHTPSPYLAVGTSTGNIDFFDVSGATLSKEPTKTFENLTCPVTSMCFHREGEVLAAAARSEKDALKLAHAGTATCFQNWPTDRTPLEHVSKIDFSRSGGLLAIGNERGKVLLYRLKQYEKG